MVPAVTADHCTDYQQCCRATYWLQTWEALTNNAVPLLQCVDTVHNAPSITLTDSVGVAV